MAERVGFEPTVRFPVRSLSRRVLSTAQSPLRGCWSFNRSKGFSFEQSRFLIQREVLQRFSNQSFGAIRRPASAIDCIFWCSARRGASSKPDLTAGCEEGLKNRGTFGSQNAGENFYLMI